MKIFTALLFLLYLLWFWSSGSGVCSSTSISPLLSFNNPVGSTSSVYLIKACNLFLFPFYLPPSPPLFLFAALPFTMTEYDFSPEAYEAYQKKIKGVERWAAETSRFNGDFASPFAPSLSTARRQLNNDSSTSSSSSDSESGITSYSRKSRPVYPKSLAQWSGPRSRAPPPRPLQLPHPPPASPLGQMPPPARSHTLPNQGYVQTSSPGIPQAQPQYPYPAQRPGPVVYYPAPAPQPVIPQQQQQTYVPPYYVSPVPKRSNTTPSRPLAYQYPYGTPVNSAGASPYPTPVTSPYGSRPTSPRAPGKNWLSRMFGALSIRGRSASPAPMSYNEPAMRHQRSRSLGPTGLRSDRERDRERDRTLSDQAQRSRSTRSARPRHRRHSDESDGERVHRRHRDRGRERERDHHRRARSVDYR
ncbi:hypothetical protein D9758_002288 [Tetrapyrgos nigripes]|uniref:Uncharacterized protein n=1 Tax=Tetrapyrgos nigripes TaxID=182062 RepID=A0A8H5LT34_9AGAR|nr:hypothetical protein D9758_002288 [Tetrapyrgos nigripes]